MSKAEDTQRIATALERIADKLDAIWEFAQQERKQMQEGQPRQARGGR